MKGRELARLARDLEWSPARLADEIGVTENSVRGWLAGNSPSQPAAKLLKQLRANLDVNNRRGLPCISGE